MWAMFEAGKGRPPPNHTAMNTSRRSFRALVGVVALSLLLALLPGAAGATTTQAKVRPRVVVAVIDDGINPYHEYFNAGGPLYGKKTPSSVTRAVLKEFGIAKDRIIRLTRTGDFTEDFAKDKAQFDKIKKGEPYWFAGTNLIGISFADGAPLRPDGTAEPHGIGTAAAVLGANPQAIVVAVEREDDLTFLESVNNASEEWAFTHPAVDIITTSYGNPVPTLGNLSSTYTGVVENGKAHFGAATNDPQYAGTDETSGPWWSIGIAGFEEGDTNGRQLSSGNVPDFVGDFKQRLPYCRSCEQGTRVVRGTSFATPRSAGTFSKILLEARRASGHGGGIVRGGPGGPRLVTGRHDLTVWQLRRALEEAAYYPGSQEYRTGDPSSVPVADQAPWLQVGWGLISPDNRYRVVHAALVHLGIRDQPKGTKPQAACDFMTANMEARRAYWERVAVLGEGFGQTEDPYINC